MTASRVGLNNDCLTAERQRRKEEVGPASSYESWPQEEERKRPSSHRQTSPRFECSLSISLFASHPALLPVNPFTKCRLRRVRLERIKDYLLMEQEFIQNQENIKPHQEKTEVCCICLLSIASSGAPILFPSCLCSPSLPLSLWFLSSSI